MDAVKFIEERNRMCGTMSEVWGVDAAKIVKNTEEWSAAHPRKTRLSVFLEQWPDALTRYGDGLPQIDPCELDAMTYNVGDCDRKRCAECRLKFWMQEVE